MARRPKKADTAHFALVKKARADICDQLRQSHRGNEKQATLDVLVLMHAFTLTTIDRVKSLEAEVARLKKEISL